MSTFTFTAQYADLQPGFDGIAGIYNGQSNSQIEITSIRLIPTVPSRDSTVIPKYTLRRITAITQGSGTSLSPVLHDTNSTSLPSQVSVIKYPSSITTTGIDVRNISALANYSFTATNTQLGYRLPGGRLRSSTSCLSMEDMFMASKGSTIEPVVLREGEGITLDCTTVTAPSQNHINVIITNNSSGATYRFNLDVAGQNLNNDSVVAILNGSGSGVILTVRLVVIANCGEVNIPLMRLAFIDGVYESTSTTSAISFNTLNSLPSTIKLYNGMFKAMITGAKNGIPDDWSSLLSGETVANIFRRGVIRYNTYPHHFSPPGSSTTIFPYWGNDAFILFQARGGSGLILNSGKGIGLLAGKSAIENSGLVNFNVEFTFKYTQFGGVSKNRIIGIT
jgi:hypothetical protein